jgi:hypothetical protein
MKPNRLPTLRAHRDGAVYPSRYSASTWAALTGYPHRGTWATGGYWDADHGIAVAGGFVATATSREGSSVLADIGAATMVLTPDPLIGGNTILGNTASELKEINAPRWGAYGGLHTEHIAFLQFTSPAAGLVAGSIIMGLIDAGANSRAIEVYCATAAVIINYRSDSVMGYPNCGPIATPVNTRQTLVFCLSGGNMYVVSAAGTSLPAADAIGALTIDRLTINGFDGAGSRGIAYYRRWGVKLPSGHWPTPLAEAQDLYTQVNALP